MNQERKKSPAFWCTLLLAGALAYPASAGPWIYVVNRFDAPRPIASAGETVYQPVFTAAERIVPEPVAALYFQYMMWWMELSGHPFRCC